MTPRPFRNLPLALVAGLALAAGSCAPRESAEPDAGAPVVPVRVAHAEWRTLRDEVVAPGRWRTTNELVVAAPFGAYVETLTVEPGDAVEPGRTLGVLVTHESRAAVLGAEQLVAAANDAASRDEAARALRQARHDLVRVPLVASASGIVIRRAGSRGAEVAEGAELVALAPRHALVFEAHVPARDAARVQAGQSAVIDMEGAPAVTATVTRRLPQSDAADQSALLWLSPASLAPAGAIDRFGTARIVVGAARRVVAVPDSSLVEDDLTGQVRLAVISRDTLAVWTAVKLGAGSAGWRELLPPAPSAGTAVVVSGQRGLPDSTHVRVER